MLGMPNDQPQAQEGGEAAGGERRLVRDLVRFGAVPLGVWVCAGWCARPARKAPWPLPLNGAPARPPNPNCSRARLARGPPWPPVGQRA